MPTVARKEDKLPKPGAVEQAVLAAVRKAGHAGITSQQLALQRGPELQLAPRGVVHHQRTECGEQHRTESIRPTFAYV